MAVLVPPRAVVLDDWRTLRRARSPGGIRQHLAQAMGEEGLVKDEDLFLDAFDYASAFHRAMTERDLREHTIEQVLSLAMYTIGAPIPPTDPAVRRATAKALERNAPQVAWYDDALPALKALKKRGTPVALVTNTIFGFGRPWGDRMSEWFPVRVLSREFGYVKPHPGPFLAAAKGLGVEPNACVYVGDLLVTDVWGAQQVGMKAIRVDRGEEAQGMFRPNDVRLASKLGIEVSAIRPDGTVSSLTEAVRRSARVGGASRGRSSRS